MPTTPSATAPTAEASTTTRPFHLAFPVHDIDAARDFYIHTLGCGTGREGDHWIDFSLFGHQVVAHLDKAGPSKARLFSRVDDKDVPIPHFGVVLGWGEFRELADRLRSKKVAFVIEPYVRFKGQVAEQSTMFLLDPSGNALEFKSFKHPDNLFAPDAEK